MKKKILFIIESLNGGGAEKVLCTYIKNLDRSKFDVSVCTIVNAGTYIEEVKSLVRYFSILNPGKKSSVFAKLKYRLKYRLIYSLLPMRWVYYFFIPQHNDIEIAFCEGFVTKLLAESSNREAKKIAWVHTDLKFNPWPQNMGVYSDLEEEKLAYSKYDKIITVSKTAENSFKEIYGLEDKILTIYNPIDVFDIRQKSLENIIEYKSTVNLITIGRLVPQKGYDILLKVVKLLKGEGRKFMLRILGDGELHDELLQYITKNELQDCVMLLGFKKNPYPYLVNSDLFICSSRSEGYSLVIAEALVLGVPVLSTYCSGPNELLGEGKYGKLVQNGDDGYGLYEGLKQLLENRKILNEYKEKAIERGQYFSLKDILAKVEGILNIMK